MSKKKLKFKKDIHTINLPFFLSSFETWEDQIRHQMDKCRKEYKVRKSARWGFSITEHGAEIKCYKK